MSKKRICTFVVALHFAGVVHGQQKFYRDDPLVAEERVDVPAKPAAVKLSDLYDRLRYSLGDTLNPEDGEAISVNTLDEVPDSAWFTNRHGATRMSIEALVRGPNQGAGPINPWTVVGGKDEGLTPGFEVVDGNGDRYVLKLDPAGVPELGSAAEVIATKLFYAFGYNVPENYIVRVDPTTLRIRPGTQVLDRFGKSAKLTETRLRRMLENIPRLPDGRIRAIASKFIDGETLGPFRYVGTRSDDPNDVVPHEVRRELRALRLFAAWLNHDDARAHNTLDSWAEQDGKRYVRHYLIDFGSTFGSGMIDLQLPNLSFHYWLDFDLMKKNALGLGFNVPKYRKVKWPHYPEYQSVGRWEATYFDPEEWKTDYPNPAFVRMTARDAFWAAKILMRFTGEELAAMVSAGEYSNPEEEAYFLETLLERQRKSGRFGLNGVNPLDEFRVEDGRLEFTNLAEQYGFADPTTTYRVTWSIYNNVLDSTRALTAPVQLADASAPLPAIRTARRTTPATARTIAFVGGGSMDVRSYTVDGDSVTFTTCGGGLHTVPRSHVDFEASARANEETSDGAEDQSPQVDGIIKEK